MKDLINLIVAALVIWSTVLFIQGCNEGRDAVRKQRETHDSLLKFITGQALALSISIAAYRDSLSFPKRKGFDFGFSMESKR